MSSLGRRKFLTGVAGLGVVVGMIAVAYLWVGYGKAVPRTVARDAATQMTEAPTLNPPREAEKAGPTEPGSDAALDDPCAFFELVDAEITKNYRPVQWKRAQFDGKSLFFSPENQAKAEMILSRYSDNFTRINSLEMTVTSSRTLVGQDATEPAEPRRIKDPLANCTLHIEAVRSPLYFKMKGQNEDGYEIEEIVTPAGEMSGKNRTFGQAASLVPTYLDGDFLFLPASLLKYGHRVLSDRVMDLEIPVLKDTLSNQSIADRRYDVIVQEKDTGYSNTFWFNKATGMLDFYVTEWSEKKEGQPPIRGVAMLDYYCVNGIYYYRDVVIYDGNCSVKSEQHVTDLIINGTRVE